MKNKNRVNPGLLVLFAALACAAVFAAGAWRGLSPTGVAAASAPLAASRVQATTNSLLSPNDLNWSDPQRVLDGGGYNNRSLISASPINGAVTLAWTNTPGDGSANVVECSNLALGGSINVCNGLNRGRPNQTEVVGNANDSFGQRHILYWSYVNGGVVCDFHVIIGTDGSVLLNETIPGSCNSAVLHKLGSMAIDNQNNVHIVLARENTTNSMGYWERLANGTWPVQNEPISPAGGPTDFTIAASSQGTVMVGYKAPGIYGGGTDVYAAVRQSPGNWVVDDISADCCQNCPRASYAYLPKFVGDFHGNIDAVWADNRCPGDPSLNSDIYYRQWVPGTGWDNQPIVTVVLNSGISYYPNLTVDPNGEVYITWSDYTSSPVGYYRIFTSYGQGTTFSPVQIPFQQWSGNAWQKESSIDYGAGFVHMSFSSIKLNPQKDNFYSYAAAVGGVPPTPTPGGPLCPNERFKDVCPGTYYYTGVQHLSAAGIINGYTTSPPCPTSAWVPCFLPYNNATRGQVAKMVVLSANIPINTHGGPHFTDVPTSNTFYQYIETAYNAGIIGGYPDHTFRPNNHVTRGQLSKMAAIAFGLHNPAGAQMFEDVPPGSTFYTYVQQLSQINVINGYPCGNPEPCVPPNNRPYFRPNNDVTRGQIAKILDLLRTLFPPTPTPTPTAQATDTPVVTATTTAIAETSTPVATDTPEVTVTTTPETTVTPGDTATPGGTETPTSVPTDTPTATQTPAA